MPHFIIILILNLNLIITGISSSKTLDNNHRRRIKCRWWHHQKNTFGRFDQRWYNHHRQTSTQFWICHRFERGWKYPQQTPERMCQLQCPNGFKTGMVTSSSKSTPWNSRDQYSALGLIFRNKPYFHWPQFRLKAPFRCFDILGCPKCMPKTILVLFKISPTPL